MMLRRKLGVCGIQFRKWQALLFSLIYCLYCFSLASGAASSSYGAYGSAATSSGAGASARTGMGASAARTSFGASAARTSFGASAARTMASAAGPKIRASKGSIISIQQNLSDPTTSVSQCFTVRSSKQCPFINGFQISPVDSLFSNESELEAFIARQGTTPGSEYLANFASDNGCSENAAAGHRYHKSLLCYSLLRDSQSCNTSTVSQMCKEQCVQYIDKVLESLKDSSLCTQSPSDNQRINRLSLVGSNSPLRAICNSSPPESPNSNPRRAQTRQCTRGTDAEFLMCGFSDDDDVADYCATPSGKNDSCCQAATNDVLKRVIPKTVNPATDKFWAITTIVTGSAILLGGFGWLTTKLTDWRKRSTPASKPLFRRSTAPKFNKPSSQEKKLALDKLGDEIEDPADMSNALYSAKGPRKSLIVNAMKNKIGDEANNEAVPRAEDYYASEYNIENDPDLSPKDLP